MPLLSLQKNRRGRINHMKESKKHLPIFGIGPALCFPMLILTVVGIVLSVKKILPGSTSNIYINMVLLVLGILLIIEGLVLFFGADFAGGLTDSIKSNNLKTNGSYRFVRNPCYCCYFLGCTGAILIAHNPILLILPVLFWIEMTIVLKNTEEKWLKNLYGQEYITYCGQVNRCIPWLPKKVCSKENIDTREQ